MDTATGQRGKKNMEMIDKKQAYQILSEYYHHTSTLQHIALKEALDRIPVMDAEPVRHGKWIPHEDEDGEHYGDKCSECGEWYVMPYGKTNFCPHCGARMDLDFIKE